MYGRVINEKGHQFEEREEGYMVEWVYGRERREKREGEMMELYYNVKKEKILKPNLYIHTG